jgi:TonB-dependent SusC/RagA subfamily outer membrane receptor
MRPALRPSRRPSIIARTSGACTCVALLSLLACASAPKSEGAPEPKQSGGGQVVATSADIQQAPNEPVEKYLAARSAGVVIGRTSEGNLTLRIRGGSSSTYGNNGPLYSLDGVPVAPDAEGGLSGLNPYDIASIKVLKDATDITMYGIRGANGVIVIKTKSAARN